VSAGHVEDGALMRLLDGECAAEERAQLESHLATCPACAERRRMLESVAKSVTAALVSGDSPAPSRRVTPRRWRMGALRAAAVLLLASVGVAAARVPPVRAWLSARWADLRGLVAPRPTPEAEARGTTTVRFVPTTATFTIELVARQDTGALTIDVSADSVASATVTPGMGSEELVVLPAGLRVVNRPDDRASYEVRLTPSVTEIKIRIGREPERGLVPTAAVRMWTIDLSKHEP